MSSEQTYEREVRVPVSRQEAFAWHERPGAFERISPPWEAPRVVERTGTIRDGDRVRLEVPLGPLSTRWEIEHEDYVEGRQFRDRQMAGPFAEWVHSHLFTSNGNGGSRLTDQIRYRLPLGKLGQWVGGPLVREKLDRVFRYRHRTFLEDLRAHARWEGRPPLKVAITGASGLVGSALRAFLSTGGHDTVPVGRPSSSTGTEARWSVSQGILTPEAMEGLDAVVHLAGESIASGRWTDEKMRRIRDSRVQGTRALVEGLKALENPPKTLVCASAIGYYGDRGEEILDEGSEGGRGFLAEVAREWEDAACRARDAGIRVVTARFGVILDPRGGALEAMLPPFKLGAGGPIGSGRQFMSWISLDDAVGALLHCLYNDQLEGPVNLVSPNPVSNKEFGKTLGRVLRRPAFAPLPAPMARLLLGRMADELLLASTRVRPERLEETGYPFRDAELEGALRWMLGRPPQED